MTRRVRTRSFEVDKHYFCEANYPEGSFFYYDGHLHLAWAWYVEKGEAADGRPYEQTKCDVIRFVDTPEDWTFDEGEIRVGPVSDVTFEYEAPSIPPADSEESDEEGPKHDL